MKHILIIGATSAVAQSTIELYAEEGAVLYLMARNKEKLERVAQDARVRGAQRVQSCVLDAQEIPKHKAALEAAHADLGRFDIVLIAYGILPTQEACQRTWTDLETAMTINGMSALSFMMHCANIMEAHGNGGTIAIISSVAGDRGRQSNYSYGTAKAMLSTFAQGLRNRLHPSGITVLTIKPGFIDTPMTAHLKKSPLFAKPERIARDIHKAITKRKDILYTPRIWFFIMSIIKRIPETIFKRLKL